MAVVVSFVTIFIIAACLHVVEVQANFAHTTNHNIWNETACPFEMSVYSCHFQGMSARSRAEDKFTHHEIKKDPFVPLAFVEKLGARTLLLYGDSMMLQSFIALVCRMHGSRGITTTSINAQWYFRDWLGVRNCPYGSKHCELGTGSCATFNGAVRMCFVWHDGVNVVPSDHLLASARSLNMTKNDVIVAGMGTWFFQGDLGKAARKFTRAVAELHSKVVAAGLQQNFMWVEASPQHFGNDRPEVQGYYNGALRKEYGLRVQPDVSHAGAGNDAVGAGTVGKGQKAAGEEETVVNNWNPTPCMSLLNISEAKKMDHRNRIPEAVLPASTPIIRIWEHLANRPHAHVAARILGHGVPELDCTHWCLPGPFVEIFTLALDKAFRPFSVEPSPL